MATKARRGNARVDAERKGRYRGKGPSGVSKWVTREVLQGYFDLPLGKASKELGVSTTIVKRLCRKLSITRWPYRQLASLDKRIAKLHALLETTQKSEIDKIQVRIPQESMPVLYVSSSILVVFGWYRAQSSTEHGKCNV